MLCAGTADLLQSSAPWTRTGPSSRNCVPSRRCCRGSRPNWRSPARRGRTRRNFETKIERLAGNAIRYQQWREPTGDLWEHFASHAAEYFTWLAELGLAKDDAEKARVTFRKTSLMRCAHRN